MAKIFFLMFAMSFVNATLSAQVDKHKIAKYIADDLGVYDYYIVLPVVIDNSNQKTDALLVGKYYGIFNLFSDTISETQYPSFVYNVLTGTRKIVISKSVLDNNWQYFQVISSHSQCKKINGQEFEKKIAELNAIQSKQGYINVGTDLCFIKDMFDNGIFIGSEDESGYSFIKTIK